MGRLERIRSRLHLSLERSKKLEPMFSVGFVMRITALRLACVAGILHDLEMAAISILADQENPVMPDCF
jgi:hypothetical protein